MAGGWGRPGGQGARAGGAPPPGSSTRKRGSCACTCSSSKVIDDQEVMLDKALSLTGACVAWTLVPADQSLPVTVCACCCYCLRGCVVLCERCDSTGYAVLLPVLDQLPLLLLLTLGRSVRAAVSLLLLAAHTGTTLWVSTSCSSTPGGSAPATWDAAHSTHHITGWSTIDR